jgi:hypothetical protein
VSFDGFQAWVRLYTGRRLDMVDDQPRLALNPEEAFWAPRHETRPMPTFAPRQGCCSMQTAPPDVRKPLMVE